MLTSYANDKMAASILKQLNVANTIFTDYTPGPPPCMRPAKRRDGFCRTVLYVACGRPDGPLAVFGDVSGRFKETAAGSTQDLEAGELPNLGRQRSKLDAVAEIQGV